MTISSITGSQRPVEFRSDGLTIRGVLNLPDGDTPCPAVILGHGLGGLKEWTLPEVAEAFVKVGIAGLWFDYRNFGDSEGEPREEVSHYGRLEDWQNAISYVASLPEIDSERIGTWGTSLGGRDVLAVSSFDRRVKAVVTQTPLIQWTPKLAARMAGFGDELERFQRELRADRTNRTLGKEPRYLPFVKQTGDEAKAEYVESLGAAELRNYKDRVTLQTFQPTVLTDVTTMIGLIAPTPILFILADGDFLPGQREAYVAAKEPKSLVTLKGNHFSPYTASKEDAILAATEWFVKHLGSK